MLKQLQEQASRLEPYLRQGEYTFIGPQDQNLFEPFMRRANNIAPAILFNHSIHHVLSNKQATLAALQILPPNTPLRIYVVTPAHNDSLLVHSTFDDYCNNNSIVL